MLNPERIASVVQARLVEPEDRGDSDVMGRSVWQENAARNFSACSLSARAGRPDN